MIHITFILYVHLLEGGRLARSLNVDLTLLSRAVGWKIYENAEEAGRGNSRNGCKIHSNKYITSVSLSTAEKITTADIKMYYSFEMIKFFGADWKNFPEESNDREEEDRARLPASPLNR